MNQTLRKSTTAPPSRSLAKRCSSRARDVDLAADYHHIGILAPVPHRRVRAPPRRCNPSPSRSHADVRRPNPAVAGASLNRPACPDSDLPRTPERQATDSGVGDLAGTPRGRTPGHPSLSCLPRPNAAVGQGSSPTDPGACVRDGTTGTWCVRASGRPSTSTVGRVASAWRWSRSITSIAWSLIYGRTVVSARPDLRDPAADRRSLRDARPHRRPLRAAGAGGLAAG
jgi:hypothetical protein